MPREQFYPALKRQTQGAVIVDVALRLGQTRFSVACARGYRVCSACTRTVHATGRVFIVSCLPLCSINLNVHHRTKATDDTRCVVSGFGSVVNVGANRHKREYSARATNRSSTNGAHPIPTCC